MPWRGILCLIKYHTMKTLREWRYSSTHFNLGTIWRWVVSLMPWLLYPQRKRPWYSLNRGGPQSLSEHSSKENRNWTLIVQPITQSLCWLSYPALGTASEYKFWSSSLCTLNVIFLSSERPSFTPICNR